MLQIILAFFKNFPDRSFEVGIAEANAIGIATGLSFDGFRPFVASFGSFLTGKNTEIRNSICYNNAPVVIVGTHCGLIGSDGATQSALQDLSIMRSMPFFDVFQPCTPHDTEEIIKYVCNSKKPTYLRIARNEIPEFLPKNYKFKVLRKPLYLLNTKNNISNQYKDEQEFFANCARNRIDP